MPIKSCSVHVKCGAAYPTLWFFAFCCVITKEILYKVGDLTYTFTAKTVFLSRDRFLAYLDGYLFVIWLCYEFSSSRTVIIDARHVKI